MVAETIRPKDLSRVTAPAAGDTLILDGDTARSILVTDFMVDQFRRFDPPSANGSNLFAGDGTGNATMAPVGGVHEASNILLVGDDIGAAIENAYNVLSMGNASSVLLKSGHDIVAVGPNAAARNVSGGAITAVGSGALFKTEAGHVTAVGTSALYNNVSGTQLVAVGRDTLYSNISGNYQVAVGNDCLPGSLADGNTGLGHNAGYGEDHTDALTNQHRTGTECTFLGAYASPTGGNQNLNNSTAIGAHAKIDKNNQVVVGNSSVVETVLRGVVNAPKARLTGTAGEGYLELPAQSGAPGAPTSGAWRFYNDASSRLSFLLSNGTIVKFDPVNLTASRTYVLPNAAGTLLALPGSAFPMLIAFPASTVNFNSANTDTAFAISLPPGYTRYFINSVRIGGASASLTTSTFGLFTATGGGGTAILTGTANAVSTAADGTNNNAMTSVPATANSAQYTLAGFPNLYFRVQTPQGTAATANVELVIHAFP